MRVLWVAVVNVYLFANPWFRPLSIDGDIMAGAYLKFFLTETTTPTPVYADASLGTSLGTEVTADADGAFPPMYMDPNITYRVELYDADDVLQRFVDPYTPPRDYAPGTILMFFGTAEARDEAYPPASWAVCDGTNGTPDMRDRFPIGVSADKEIGDTGGALVDATGEAGAHDHGGASAETVLDETNMPVHGHRLYCRTSSTQRGNTRGFGFASTAGLEGQVIDDAPYGYVEDSPSEGDPLVEPTGTADPAGHAHDIAAAADHTHSIAASLPPWCALWFLMRKLPV